MKKKVKLCTRIEGGRKITVYTSCPNVLKLLKGYEKLVAEGLAAV